MTDDHVEPEDLRRLLSAVESSARPSPRRDDIRRAVLGEFDAARADPSIDVDLAAVEDWDIIDVGTDAADVGRRPRSRRAYLLVAAAAALLVLVAIVGLRQEELADDLDATGSPGPTAAVVEPTVVPGPYASPAVAGGVAFDAPAGLALEQDGNGVVRFRVIDSATDGDDMTVSIVDSPVTGEQLAASIAEAVDAQDLVAVEQAVDTRSGPASRWQLGLPPTFFMPADCVTTQECLTVPVLVDLADPPRLRQDADTFVTVVSLANGRDLLVIEAHVASSSVAAPGPAIIAALRST